MTRTGRRERLTSSSGTSPSTRCGHLAAGARPDHDQVGVVLLGVQQDPGDDTAGADVAGRLDALLAQMREHQVGGLLRLLLELGAGQRGEALQLEAVDADDRDLAPVCFASSAAASATQVSSVPAFAATTIRCIPCLQSSRGLRTPSRPRARARSTRSRGPSGVTGATLILRISTRWARRRSPSPTHPGASPYRGMRRAPILVVARRRLRAGARAHRVRRRQLSGGNTTLKLAKPAAKALKSLGVRSRPPGARRPCPAACASRSPAGASTRRRRPGGSTTAAACACPRAGRGSC